MNRAGSILPVCIHNNKLHFLFGKENDHIEEKPCAGCEKKTAENHNGEYVKIMDWVDGKPVRFLDLVFKK